MKNRSCKTILVFLALGLISCAFCVQQAQADPIQNVITFAGGAELNSGSVNTATAVTGWLDEMGNGPTVQSVSGVFAQFANVGDTVTFTPTWSFNSGPIAMFWTVDGFTFDLIASHIIYQANGFLAVYGNGTITGHGYNKSGTWRFSTQDDSSNGVFSFSASTVPDGGATVALLGLALAGIEGIRRKLIKKRS
ncbi:MAG: VPDSG-CTERM sorting domain-containing protein [Candidatus Udaeobacter sp.]